MISRDDSSRKQREVGMKRSGGTKGAASRNAAKLLKPPGVLRWNLKRPEK